MCDSVVECLLNRGWSATYLSLKKKKPFVLFLDLSLPERLV